MVITGDVGIDLISQWLTTRQFVFPRAFEWCTEACFSPPRSQVTASMVYRILEESNRPTRVYK